MTRFSDLFVGSRRRLMAAFGQVITYTAYGSSAASITAIWSGEQAAGSDYDDGIQEIARGDVICSTADVASPDRRDTFTIGGETWRISRDEDRWEIDNVGLITMRLVKYAREEVSGAGHRIDR